MCIYVTLVYLFKFDHNNQHPQILDYVQFDNVLSINIITMFASWRVLN